MRKGFFVKFRLSRVIPTFQSCRSKDPSTLPTNNPVPSSSFLHRHSSATAAAVATRHKLNQVSTTTNRSPRRHKSHHGFSLKSHVSSAFASARRGCMRTRASPEPTHTESPPPFKWHVITKDHRNYDSTPPRRKIYNSAASEDDNDEHCEDDVVFLPPLPSKTRPDYKIRRRKKPPKPKSFHHQKVKVRISTSSDSGLFSDDDNDNDKQTLVSSDSLSPVNYSRHVSRSKEREANKSSSRRRRSCDAGNASPARLSEFMRRMTPYRAVANGKVRESFAMVKKSEEPYEDFKRSMAEMVVEKQIFEERELEELLRCFLSLNSERHHDAIVRAFTEIWKALFFRPNNDDASASTPELIR